MCSVRTLSITPFANEDIHTDRMPVFTGVSPVNTPYFGFGKLFSPLLDLGNRRARYEQRKDSETGLP